MTVLDGYQEFFQGDSKPLRFKWWDADDPTIDVSAATVSCILFAPDRTQALATGAMSHTGSTVLDCKRTWAPVSPTNPIGKYRCVATVIYSGNIIQVQWAIMLKAVPGAE